MNAHGLLLGSRGRTAQDPSCLSSSPKYSERPNTMQFWIHVLLWHCTIRQAGANFSFLLLTVTLSILQVYQGQRAQATDSQKLSRTEKQTQREGQAERNILRASKLKKYLLLEQTKPFCSYSKPRNQNITFCWETRGMTGVLFIQFLISLLRLKLFSSFHLLKASAL